MKRPSPHSKGTDTVLLHVSYCNMKNLHLNIRLDGLSLLGLVWIFGGFVALAYGIYGTWYQLPCQLHSLLPGLAPVLPCSAAIDGLSSEGPGSHAQSRKSGCKTFPTSITEGTISEEF